jgi:hypothetical protein
MDLAKIRFEAKIRDLPRGLKTKGCGEKCGGFQVGNHLNAGSKGPSGYADFH